MKSILALLLIFLVNITARSQDFNDAVDYNNYIIKEQNLIISQALVYMSWSVHSEDANDVEKRRMHLVNDIQESIKKINKMPPFNGSSRLKNQTLEVFELYVQIYETDLLKMLGLKKKYRDNYEALEAYLAAEKEVDEKMKKALEKLSRAQESFAKANDIKFQEDKGNGLAFEVDQINLLSNYSRRVFLEYFYVSWKFQDMVSILHERNGKLLDRKREDVMESATKALKNLKAMERFNNDREYMGQTVDLIEYLLGLSRREFARIAVIYKKETLTQKDANYINKVFNDYNANIQTLVYNWNLANQSLWKGHVKDMY